MGLSRVVSEIFNVENMATLKFSRKSQNFPTPYILCPAEGYPWNWVSEHGVKNYSDGAAGPRKKFDEIFSRLDTIHQRDGRTDGRTPGDSKYRAYA